MRSNFPILKKMTLLALGAESAGNFSVYKNGEIFMSADFSDLLEEKNWRVFQKAILEHLRKNRIKPNVILTDLHPFFRTTLWGKELAEKFKALHVQVQHHHAHIFSALGDKFLQDEKYKMPEKFYGAALDGTGYGLDEKIWGGEIFQINSEKLKIKSLQRIGHLENQILLGGEIAIREPARMLLGILDKVFSNSSSREDPVYPFVKKYYTPNEFGALRNQLRQNFNCLETSSAGRILDATSLLLGFCDNERQYKHEPIDLLEKNSTLPFSGLKPKIIKNQDGKYILDTTYLFKYLSKYPPKDKKRLATTAQLYLAQGLYEIIKLNYRPKPVASHTEIGNIFLSGGIAKNKIISDYFISQGAYASQEIPCGDAGISFGQIIYYLMLK